jgi:hypothetical protein
MRLLPAFSVSFLVLGSCSLMPEDGFEVKQWNARLGANLSYTGEVDIDGSTSSVTSDFDDSSYGFAVEAENAEGWAPFVEYGRGSWNFDWPVEVDFERFSFGSRFYMDDMGDGESILAGTRPFFSGALAWIQPQGFYDGAERHHMNQAWALNLGAGLQREFSNDLFVEVGAQLVYGQLDEAIRNEVTTATADTSWDWNDVQLVFGVGKRF